MENKIKIKESSKTNCPKCGKKKNGKYPGLCYECEYPEEMKIQIEIKFSKENRK